MAWICIAVASPNLDTVLFELLGAFHGTAHANFEVHTAWAVDRVMNQMYLSPEAYNGLAGLPPDAYEILGPVEALPEGCDLLMGNQAHRPTPVVHLNGPFVAYDELIASFRIVPQGERG
ncbi:MAG: hypothetical protein ACK46X_15790 [Candidatus Sericytochromatia bacterium]